MQSYKAVILFSLIVMHLVDQPAPEVTIEQGTLSGRISDDGLRYEYLGIPYATTNQTSRFQAPLSPPKWKGIFKATDDTTACPQDNIVLIRGTEDCLKINVFVPVFSKRPLPVMVFVHGGAFYLGDGSRVFSGPKFLLKEDVILVTFNYRLGILGFLCLGIKEAPGNAALKDQLAALRWVKKNIEAFGGDSTKITVFGVSAGAASVSLLIASGKINNLVQRAIIQSGSAVSHWSITRKPVWVASFAVKSLGYDTDDPHELYKILSNMPYKELAALPSQKPVEKFLDTALIYLPCIEKSFPEVESIITDYPYKLYRKNPTNISIIHGTTSREGLFFIALETKEDVKYRNGKYLMASDVEFATDEEANNVSLKIKDFYFGGKDIDDDTAMNRSELYKHLHFEIPCIIESEILADSSAAIYNYNFDYSGNRNYVKYSLGYGDVVGACHGDELLYIFDAVFWPFKINKEDSLIIKRMVKMWTNFAKYGDPTPEITEEIPIRWQLSSKKELKFLYINKIMKMDAMPSPKAYRLWMDIYSKYRRN